MSKTNRWKNKKFYKVKNAKKSFLCALCEAPREMRYSKNLQELHYIQLVILSVFSTVALWPIMSFRSLSLVIVYWAIMEVGNKLLYRKELACPHCGFDPTWYRRDVKLAKARVEQFWEGKVSKDKSAELEEATEPEEYIDPSILAPQDEEFSNTAQ